MVRKLPLKSQFHSNSYPVGMYIAARIILGFGIPTCIVSGSSLIGELAYPKERPIMTSLFNVAYFVGKLHRGEGASSFILSSNFVLEPSLDPN